jgi:acetyl-CoA/propionyl-CoA carboxylase biotin carboxyl carrier protein
MLAKVIAWGANRREAIARLDRALDGVAIAGVATNIAFLRRLLADEVVLAGDLDTGLVERRLDVLIEHFESDAEVALLAAAVALLEERYPNDPWHGLVGWRHGGPTGVRRELDVVGGDRVELTVEPVGATTWRVHSDATGERSVELQPAVGGRTRVGVDGRIRDVLIVATDGVTHVVVGGSNWSFGEVVHRGHDDGPGGGDGDGVVRSPMPGTVISISVTAGDEIVAGQTVAIVEAMKMEHTLTSPIDGTVEQVHSAEGASVALDQALVTITAAPTADA